MEKLTFALTAVLLFVMLFGYLNFRQDDAYIFYSYAKNIAEGNGYVYNIGEKINATTSPLYTLLLAVLYFIAKNFSNDIFPFLGNLIGVASLAIIILAVKKIWNNAGAFNFFPLILLANPLLKFGFGMETFLNLALITLSVLMFTEAKYNFSFLFAGLSVLARLDSFLFAAVLFFFYLIKNKNIPPIKSIMVFFLTIATWFIFSFFYFDSFLPTTIAVKLSQEKFQMFGEGLVFLKGFMTRLPGTTLTAIIIITSLVLSVLYIVTKRKNIYLDDGTKIILLWGIALFISYAFILNAPPYPWYYSPFALPFTLIISITIGEIIKGKRSEVIILSLIFITACLLPLKTYTEGYYPKFENYKNIAEWLNKNSTANTTIAVDEVGILRYYFRNGKIVDALGLVTPEVVPHLNQKNFGWYISKYQPDFIINDYPEIMNHAGRDDERFTKHYYPVKVFNSHGEKMAVYKKQSEIIDFN